MHATSPRSADQILESASIFTARKPSSTARSNRAAMSSIISADRPTGDRAGVDGRVRRDRIATWAAEKLVDGAGELLPGEVVKCDVDRGERMDSEASPGVVDRPSAELGMDRADLERVASEQHPAKTAAPRMDVVHEYELTYRRCRCIGLSHADPAVLVVDPDEDGLARAVEVTAACARPRAQDYSLDLCDHRGVHGAVGRAVTR